MSTFKLPLSGNVTQSINPWTVCFHPIGGQTGLINIDLGRSSAPGVEADVLAEVGSYGRQLGRIGDAMAVLVRHLPRDKLDRKEREAIDALRRMLKEVRRIKRAHVAVRRTDAATS